MKPAILQSLKQTSSHQRIIFVAVVIAMAAQLWYMYHIAMRSLFLPDDAYYYFALARNVVAGNGPKVDSFHNTTGFQPLWGVVCVIAFGLMSDSTVAIQSLLLVSLVVEGLTIWLVYRWMAALSLPAPAMTFIACGWLLSSQTMLNSLNGMETGLAILFVVAVYYSLRFRNVWATGLLCGMAVLARTDALILGISLSLVWLYQKQFRQTLILWGVSY
jgi:hypothetical protein